jgi:hypothetical protein
MPALESSPNRYGIEMLSADSASVLLPCGNQILVSVCDLHLLEQSTWKLVKGKRCRGYVRRGRSPLPEKKITLLHRLILQAPDEMEVDHINGDTADNRRENLRLVTRAQNCKNIRQRHVETRASKFKGVTFCKQTQKWRASISDGKKYRQLGRFATDVEAAYHYDQASLQFKGEFGYRNFLPLC